MLTETHSEKGFLLGIWSLAGKERGRDGRKKKKAVMQAEPTARTSDVLFKVYPLS